MLNETKICKKCGIEKPIDQFRLRVEHRIKNGDCYYRVGTCKECEKKAAKEYHNQIKDTEGFKEKKRQYAMNRYWRRRDELILKQREARKTKRHKENRKAYIQKNKDKIYLQEVVTKKRYHEKNRDALTDVYIINLFLSNGKPHPTPLQIEIKRSEILIQRIKKITKNHKIGKTKKCSKCGQVKDLSEFYLRKGKSGNILRSSICKYCNSKNCANYREKQKNNGKKNIERTFV